MIDVVVLVVLFPPLVDFNKFHGGQNPMVMKHLTVQTGALSNPHLFTPLEAGLVGASCKER